jgi:hypothetical protein
VPPGARIERTRKRSRRAQNALRKKGCIHERLAAAREVQVIGRRRIDSARDRPPHPFGVARSEPSLITAIVGELEPRRDAGI